MSAHTNIAADQSTRAAGYLYRVCSVAALGGLLFGFDTAVINGAIVFLKAQFALSEIQVEIAASSLLAGCVAGASLAGFLSDRFGRRRVLLASAALFLLSSLGAALPRTLTEFVGARFAGGLAIGVASVMSPLYIAEISPARLRGRLVTLNQLAIVSGILLAYLINWQLSKLGAASWRWMFAVAALPSLVFLLNLLLVPESPRWLVKQGRMEEALLILKRLSGPAAAQAEAAEIRDAIALEKGSVSELCGPALRRPLTIAVALAVLSQVTGINTILYYGSLIFTEHGGQNARAALGANVIIGVVNLAGTIVALFTIDRFGRKPLLITGSAAMAVALTALAAAFHFQASNPALLLGLILAYVAAFAISLGPGAWLLMSELFPTKVRGRAAAIATITLWLACLAVTFTFLTLVSLAGPAGAFCVYASLCILTVIFVWRGAPETKGRTLEEIENLWRPNREL